MVFLWKLKSDFCPNPARWLGRMVKTRQFPYDWQIPCWQCDHSRDAKFSLSDEETASFSDQQGVFMWSGWDY